MENRKVIFTYRIAHLKKKDKVRFYYALKGRDGKTGIVKKCSIFQLGRTVLMVSEKFEGEVSEFLEYWGCHAEKLRVIVLK